MASVKLRGATDGRSAGHQGSLLRFLTELCGAVHCAISIKLASDLSYLSVNPAARDLFGASAGEVGKTDADIFPARMARRITADDKQVIASGAAGPVVQEDRETTLGLRTFCTQKIPLVGIEGTPDVLITISEDVTAEAQRLGNASMWEHVFKHSSRGIVVGLPEGTTLQLMNSAFADLFGSTVGELSGRPLMDIFAPSVHGRVKAMLELAWQNGQHRFETLCLRQNGSTFPAVVEASAVREVDGVAHYRVIRIEDVSLLRSQERAMRDDRDEANRANTAKSLFVASLSHELRTPLNVILSFAQVMQLEKLSPIQAESVAHILQAGNHLLAVIDEALDISSVESGRIALTLEPVLVASIVSSVLELMQPLAETAGIQLVNESKRSVLCAVADKHRLQQILLNLTTNAINYNVPDGEVRFRIRRQGGMVNISVIDSGLGIPPGRSHRVFVPFDRLGREAMDVEGTGLGLSLSKGLAEAMGGTIIAAPNVGRGTTFTVTLAASPSALGAGKSTAASEPPQAERGQVLFIVDSPASIRLIEEVQQRRPGVRVLTAMQSGIGIELARYHHPDVIVLDAYLPDLTGEETTLRLSKDERTRAIPVVMASSEARRRKYDVRLKPGDAGYLARPIGITELLAAIDAALGDGDECAVADDLPAPPVQT